MEATVSGGVWIKHLKPTSKSKPNAEIFKHGWREYFGRLAEPILPFSLWSEVPQLLPLPVIVESTALECSSYTQVAMAIQTGRYAGFLPEFAKGTAFAGSPAVIQRPMEKSLHYERSLTLAWREATVRARPVLKK